MTREELRHELLEMLKTANVWRWRMSEKRKAILDGLETLAHTDTGTMLDELLKTIQGV